MVITKRRALLPQPAPVRMVGMVDLLGISLAIPARRHRCEICEAIFDCHLCTIRRTHDLHVPAVPPEVEHIADRKRWADQRTHFFRCKPCIEESGRPVVTLRKGQQVNELTGKVVSCRTAVTGSRAALVLETFERGLKR